MDIRKLKDKIFRYEALFLSFFIIVLFISVILGLLIRSIPVLKENTLIDVIFKSQWHPLKGDFGLLYFIMGTFIVTLLSSLIAVPLCIFASLYISEFINKRFKKIILTFVDILAGIPSVIYGVWGIIIIIPIVKYVIAPIFNAQTSGYNILTASITLAVMISPVIIQFSVQILESIPIELREASLALGANKWETTKYVVFKKALPGIIAAVILGISRALGETMAVLMLVGNSLKIPKSIFDPAYTLTALLANNYGEMMSIPLYDSALMLSAFILLAIVILFNIISKLILRKINKVL